MEKTKEPGKIVSDGVGQQTWNRNVKLVEKQTVRKEENTTRKARSEERKITRKSGNWTLRNWLYTGNQEHRTEKNGTWSQQSEENVEHAVLQQTDMKTLKQLLPNGSTGGLVVSKALSLNLNFSFLN